MNSFIVQIQDAIMHRLPKTGHSYFMYLEMFNTLRIRQDEKISFYDLFWVAKQVGGYAKKTVYFWKLFCFRIYLLFAKSLYYRK